MHEVADLQESEDSPLHHDAGADDDGQSCDNDHMDQADHVNLLCDRGQDCITSCITKFLALCAHAMTLRLPRPASFCTGEAPQKDAAF